MPLTKLNRDIYSYRENFMRGLSGSARRALQAVEAKAMKAIRSLGIIVSPREKCREGFERIVVTSPLNKTVHICRLGPGIRKIEPEKRPKGKPMRRRKEFSPGIVTRDIRRG